VIRSTYHTGDVLATLAKLEPGSVDLVLTSPPFLALRSYLPADHPDKALEGGQERTPGEFIDWLLDVVEACDRVLAPHGSMAIELGDTFAGSGGAGGDYAEDGLREGQAGFRQEHGKGWPASKSLTLIPELFRIGLVYGINPLTGRKTTPWRVRNVIRWVRPNPPVGALGDKFRPATSEMVVFCRTDEAGRKRYFDLDAVRLAYDGEPPVRPQNPAMGKSLTKGNTMIEGKLMHSNPAGAPPLDWWEIPTHPYKGAHYATWPPDLCVKPIKAMSPEKVCVTCGEASRRVVESTRYLSDGSIATTDFMGGNRDTGINQKNAVLKGWSHNERTEIGWTDCGHDTWRPGTVLDPFAGSGTTLAVAVGHGRNAIGIDLDERNVELARDRVGPMFFEWANEPGGAA
jgi:hypothetical protein